MIIQEKLYNITLIEDEEFNKKLDIFINYVKNVYLNKPLNQQSCCYVVYFDNGKSSFIMPTPESNIIYEKAIKYSYKNKKLRHIFSIKRVKMIYEDNNQEIEGVMIVGTTLDKRVNFSIIETNKDNTVNDIKKYYYKKNVNINLSDYKECSLPQSINLDIIKYLKPVCISTPDIEEFINTYSNMLSTIISCNN